MARKSFPLSIMTLHAPMMHLAAGKIMSLFGNASSHGFLGLL
jgi:hypothetical protein